MNGAKTRSDSASTGTTTHSHRESLVALWWFLPVAAVYIGGLFAGLCATTTACTGPFFDVSGCFFILGSTTEYCAPPGQYAGLCIALVFLGVFQGAGFMLTEVAFAPVYSYLALPTVEIYDTAPWLVYATFLLALIVVGFLWVISITVALTNVLFVLSMLVGVFVSVALGTMPVFLWSHRAGAAAQSAMARGHKLLARN